MGASGTTTVDFGAFPGKTDALTVVSGQTGFVVTSELEVWIQPVATADHSFEEHMIEQLRPFGVYFADGTFLAWVFHQNSVVQQPSGLGAQDLKLDMGTRVYGLWTVGWVWN
jgi:hypothetical protein